MDDARLVVLNAVDAAERGATIRTRTKLVRADREGNHWQLVLNVRGHREVVDGRCAGQCRGSLGAGRRPSICCGRSRPQHVRLIKGSHIVVPRLFEHDHAYIFQNADGRIVFAIPYERDLTLLGTTDLDFKGDLAAPAASPDEITYLCRAASVYFRHPRDAGSGRACVCGRTPAL